MIYVAGLDLSLARVAIAVITRRVDGSAIAAATSFTSRAPAGEERVTDLARCADRAVCAAQLVVIAPADGPPAGGLRRAVLAALTRRGVQVATVAPADVGTTDVAGLWPRVTPANAGELAALRLAHHAAVRQGWVLPRGVTPSGLDLRSVRQEDFALYGSRDSTRELQPRQPRRDATGLERQLATKRRVQPRVRR